MSNVMVAIIGCGKQAPKHISGLRRIPGVDIILADKDVSLARKLGEKESLPWLESVEEVFTNADINAVDICTPTPSHAPLIRDAVKAGKDFFCEKPLTEDFDEAKELAELVEKNGRIGMVGYIYRFAPIFEQGKSITKGVSLNGECMTLGGVSVAHFRAGGRGSHQRWKHVKAHGGGAINEMLVHMVDLAVWYFGAVKDVDVLACDLLRPQRKIQGDLYDVDAEDYVLVRLTTESGVNVFCQADLVTPAFTQFIEIQGDRGTFVGSIQADMPSYLYVEEEVAGFQKGKNLLDFGGRNLFEAQMADFINSVQTGEQPSRSTVQDSVLLMEAMMKIKQGIKS